MEYKEVINIECGKCNCHNTSGNLSIFKVTTCPFYSIRDSGIGIATGYGLDDRGVGVKSW
ncbi:hypothetical protein B7P43_G14155 [Cryptotermes secundus]|uniref:Uncharacterized protein n=1 Tax=Cryptotermes secundus TaxID=105785 RepID=A0A2J7QAX9_9NEOP|nr:hypothetical protein B7P43_G14155 [Cryptotermes secundus]